MITVAYGDQDNSQDMIDITQVNWATSMTLRWYNSGRN